MTTVKILGKPSTSASEVLHAHAQPLYDKPGSSRIGIVVLKRRFITTPDPGEETEPIINLGMARLEFATPEQEDHLRQALDAMMLHRTAAGTLDDDGQIQLTTATLKAVTDHLDRAEAARYRVGLQHWIDYARAAVRVEHMTEVEARHELHAVAAGLSDLLHAHSDDRDQP